MFVNSIRFSVIIVVSLILTLYIFLLYSSWPFLLNKGLHSLLPFQNAGWFPLEGEFNLFPMLYTSFLLMIISALISTPISLITAVHLFFSPYKVVKKISLQSLTLLSGVPSVVLGFWGLVTIVPLINSLHSPGTNLLAGLLCLVLMIYPFQTLLILNAFSQSPKSLLHALSSFNFPLLLKLKCLFPVVRKAIYSSFLLSAGRALGETMIVTMVCGNIPNLPRGILSPVRALTSNIALEMSYAMDLHRSSLFFSGFILVLMTSVLTISTHLFLKQREFLK